MSKRRRAYIGNLRPRPNLAEHLYHELCIPSCLEVRNYPNGNGIVVAEPKMQRGSENVTKGNSEGSQATGKIRGGKGGRGGRESGFKPTSMYAFIEFTDLDYAIQVLDGIQFDGRTLRASKEKTNISGTRKGMGFGSSRWAGDDGDDHRNSNCKKDRVNNQVIDKVTSPKEQSTIGTSSYTKVEAHHIQAVTKSSPEFDGVSTEEEIANNVQKVISSEISESSDKITTAIACTASMALLSSIDAFGLDGHFGYESHAKETNTTGSDIDDITESAMSNQDFQSRCKLSLSELLSEYGEQDFEWKKQHHSLQKSLDVTPKSQLQPQNPLAKKNTQHRTHGAHESNTVCQETSNNGMLGQFGKAPIHVELVSFGYKYGAPPYSKKGFTYAHPLPPLDVRDLDRAPGNVAKFNGLSHLVKRALLNPSKVNGNGQKESLNESDSGKEVLPNSQSPMRKRANEIADEAIKILAESIDEGGHGVISPLTMTISIGSEYGRHRSVVMVEHLAVILRARLRRNDGKKFNESESSANDGGTGNGILKQPVSVGTRHRDIDARHRDEEAFGEDLKRSARAAEAKRRHVDDDDW